MNEYIDSKRYHAILKLYLKLEKENMELRIVHAEVIEKCVNDKIKLQKRLKECQKRKS